MRRGSDVDFETAIVFEDEIVERKCGYPPQAALYSGALFVDLQHDVSCRASGATHEVVDSGPDSRVFVEVVGVHETGVGRLGKLWSEDRMVGVGEEAQVQLLAKDLGDVATSVCVVAIIPCGTRVLRHFGGSVHIVAEGLQGCPGFICVLG